MDHFLICTQELWAFEIHYFYNFFSLTCMTRIIFFYIKIKKLKLTMATWLGLGYLDSK